MANVQLANEAADLLRDMLVPIKIEIRKKLLNDVPEDFDGISGSFAALRLIDPSNRDARASDSFAIRDFERRVLEGTSRARGVPYEGFGLMKLYGQLLGSVDKVPEEISVVLTDRLIMTWSEDDMRYHARVATFGFPCIISTSGMVEAPARPREYYLAKQALDIKGIGLSEAALAEEFAGRYIEADDERMNEILRGYLMQCLFYSFLIEPFCENRDCMLFNSHWQEEMIHAQLESARLCPRHESMLARMLSGGQVGWAN